ncbi:MAG: DUF1360 domain-containing protein [Acidimicrobiales bacterium]
MSSVVTKMRDEAEEYKAGDDRPLASYTVLASAYGAAAAGMAVFVRRRRGPLPERLSWGDLALVTLATHRLARLISKDPITSPVRAAFTRYEGQSGPAELAEQVRGRGLRKAVGELVSCPFCLSQWLASAAVFGLVVAPRATRLAASVLAVVAGADILQFAYSKLES